MLRIDYTKLTPHVLAVGLFILITMFFFYPMMQGERLKQNDVMTHAGNSKGIKDFRAIYDSEPLWTNRSFGGFPAYNMSMKSDSNLMSPILLSMLLGISPASFLLIALLGFYILLLALKFDPWLAVAGAIAFALSSYFIIIITAGHSTKAVSIALMAPVVAGVIMAFRGEYLKGAAITGLFLALMVRANHLQIIYYLLILLVLFGIFRFWHAFREKNLEQYFKGLGILLVAAMLAIGTHSTHFLLTYQYSDSSTRGQSELTSNSEVKTGGLDKDYITAWSYGVEETWTLLIPNFMGGASYGPLTKSSEVYEVLKDNRVPNAENIIKQVPIYWGTQPMQSGPVYLGAVLCFLFVLGLMVVKGPVKWWLLSATALSIVLAWGKHFPEWLPYNMEGVIHNPITDFFLDHVPMYDKFRVVSTILVVAQLTVPLLGFLALKAIFEGNIPKPELFRKLKISLGILGGITLLFALIPGAFFDFNAANDARLAESGWPDFLLEALVVDRGSMVRMESIRSLILILITGGGIWMYLKGHLQVKKLHLGLIALILFDLAAVNKRYLNADNFEKVRREKKSLFTPSSADMDILTREFTGNEKALAQYQSLIEKAEAEKKGAKRSERQLTQEERLDIQFTALNFNSNFRVMNLSLSTFNDATTSYYHKSIGGYHGAKMKRWQELVDFHLGRRNQSVLDMMNTKYFIVPGENNQLVARENQGALGNCWFVENYKLVENADAEIAALADFSPWEVAIVDERFQEHLNGFTPTPASGGTVVLEDYKPNNLIYTSNSAKDELAVFSEIYYQPGWNAYVDGEEVEHFRVNYVLRAMVIPKGDHKIEFKFEPVLYGIGESISLVSSSILILLLLGIGFKELKHSVSTVDKKEE